MAATSTHSNRIAKGNRKRKGVHAKTRNSKLKNSKNYKKPYRGQGR